MDDPNRNLGTPEGTLPTAIERPQRDRAPGVVASLRAEAQLGKYRIVRHLGAGGMGAVYEAVHVEIGKAVALKVLTAALASDPRAHARFLKEAANLSRLAHPHVVSVTDFGTDAESPYLVMELLRGEDLAHYLGRHLRGLPVENAVEIVLAVCSGIIAAHQAGIVHRDIKPTNIFLAQSPLREIQPKVLDFGIAKLDGEASDVSQTQKGAVVGTPQYLSPEQVKGAPADARSDQYTLGVVLFECLVGRNPYDGHSQFEVMKKIAAGQFIRPTILRSDIPIELERQILRAMANDPAERFASVFDFGRALVPFASPLPRANWGRYFAGEEGSAAAVPVATVPLPKTSLLPGPTNDRPSGDQRVLSDESWYVNSSTSNQSIDQATFRTRGRTARRVAVILAGVAAAGAVAAFVAWPRLAVVTIGATPRHGSESTAAETTTNGLGVETQVPPLVAPNPSEPAGSAAPAPRSVTVTLEGLPPGAKVLVDGWEKRLPLELPRGDRERELTIQAPGYEPEVRRFVPNQNQVLSIAARATPTEPASPPGKQDAVINIASEPPGALVWIDGEPDSKGRTPMALGMLASSEPRKITLQLDGYRPRSLIVVPDGDRSPDVVRLMKVSPAARRSKLTARPPVGQAPNEITKAHFIKLPD